MKTTFVSTLALTDTVKRSLMKAQARLIDAQKEVATGRHADIGRTLGFRTGESVSLRQDFARLAAIRDSNAIASTRLQITQNVLGSIGDDAQSFINALVASRHSENGPRVARVESELRLGAFVDALNTAVEGAYIFSGINTDVRPLEAYLSDPPNAARQSVIDAFTLAFGMAPSDPAVATISAADMKAFLDGPFAALTDEPNWSANWSSASDQNIRSRISTSEVVETSITANIDPLRKLMNVYVMVADLGIENLNGGAFQTLIDTAVETAGTALHNLTAHRANLGTAEERVVSANMRMSIQIDVLQSHVMGLESVDPYEASTRVTTLLTQIETSYALTSRLQRLSLLNYL